MLPNLTIIIPNSYLIFVNAIEGSNSSCSLKSTQELLIDFNAGPLRNQVSEINSEDAHRAIWDTIPHYYCLKLMYRLHCGLSLFEMLVLRPHNSPSRYETSKAKGTKFQKLSLNPPKFVHALSIRIQPIRPMHENCCDQKYKGGPVAFHLHHSTSAALRTYLSTIPAYL